MRALNTKQKKLIDDWFNQNWTGQGSIYCSDQMPVDLLTQIVSLNDYETIWQDIDRYLNDKACKLVYGK